MWFFILIRSTFSCNIRFKMLGKLSEIIIHHFLDSQPSFLCLIFAVSSVLFLLVLLHLEHGLSVSDVTSLSFLSSVLTLLLDDEPVGLLVIVVSKASPPPLTFCLKAQNVLVVH